MYPSMALANMVSAWARVSHLVHCMGVRVSSVSSCTCLILCIAVDPSGPSPFVCGLVLRIRLLRERRCMLLGRDAAQADQGTDGALW